MWELHASDPAWYYVISTLPWGSQHNNVLAATNSRIENTKKICIIWWQIRAHLSWLETIFYRKKSEDLVLFFWFCLNLGTIWLQLEFSSWYCRYLCAWKTQPLAIDLTNKLNTWSGYFLYLVFVQTNQYKNAPQKGRDSTILNTTQKSEQDIDKGF